MVERIGDIPGLPEIGKRYLVPTVTARWYGKDRAWPVIGPKHNDKHCFNFEWQHYHLDARFLSTYGRDDDFEFWRSVLVSPVMTSERINSDGLPDLAWRRMTCKRLANPFNDRIAGLALSGPSRGYQCLTENWAGVQSKYDGRGWVCPHRNVPLSGVPVVDGVIRCPLHLLRIDATTGKVLPMEVVHG